MPSEIRALGEFVEIKHGFAFSGRHIVSNETKRILLTPGHFEIGGGFRHNHKKYYDSEDYKPGYELEPGELIVSMTDLSKEGDTLGYSAIIPKIDGKILLHNQRIGSVIFKDEKLDKGFCHYLLRDRVYRQHILATCTGSTVKHTSPTKILDFRFALPEKSEQKAIAQILGTLDDKIELNQRMNQTLEDIAKAIFKSWFVDFDPVRAKVEGRPTGLPDEISDLFPDELEESEIGEIPAGWKFSSLAEIADIQNGYAFKSKDWSDDGEIPVIKIGNVKPTIVDVENCSRVRRAIVSGLDRFKLMRGDILIGMTGYVGEVGLVPNAHEMPYLNQRVGRIIPLKNDDYGFVVALCRREEFKSEVENLGTGSAQANVSSGSIKGIRLPLPPQNLRKVFHETASSIIDRILLASEEARCLSELRDTLLPKLISGELRISDAEKFLAEAGI
jgi:type I restriction enzyme S subunit